MDYQDRIKKAQDRKELSIVFWAANNGATAFCPEKDKGTPKGYKIVQEYREKMTEDFFSYKLDKEEIELEPIKDTEHKGKLLKPWEAQSLKDDEIQESGQAEKDKEKI